MKKAIIIGAGMGGLSTAIRLAHAGFSVEVIEASDRAGGKLNEKWLNGFRFDTGPSLFTLPALADELFTLSGRDPRNYFSYEKVKESCHYFWEDGKKIAADSDPSSFASACETEFGIPAKKIMDYFSAAEHSYELTKGVFLERSLHQLKNFFRKDVLKGIFGMPRLNLFSTMHQVNEKRMQEPHMVQLFDRFATYNGSDPYQSPGILTMIPHLEHNIGTFFPKGGMIEIPNALYRLATDLGVKFRFSTRVERIRVEQGKAVSVILQGTGQNQEEQKADVIVSNMDVVPTYRSLLKDQQAPEKTLAQERSSSALIFYWGIKKEFSQLALHNIFFSADYEKEFRTMFRDRLVSEDPTVYVHISSKYCSEDAPAGKENWFVLVNAPGNKGQDWDRMIPEIREHTIRKLSRMLGEDISQLIDAEDLLEPRTIESRTSSYQGSLYGAASNNRNAAFLRHPNFSRKIRNLYFCGGSVHPGGGIPLCLLSGKITAEIIQSQQGS